MVTKGTSRHAALMNARCSTAAASSPGASIAVSADGARIDLLAHVGGERHRALRTSKIGGPFCRRAQRGIDGVIDQACRRDEVLLPMAAAKPVQQHGGREDKGDRIGLVLTLNVRCRAMLRLRHAVAIAEVDRCRQTEA